MSGGRATRARLKGKMLRRQVGDVTAIAPEGHPLTDKYYIECKFYNGLEVDRFMITGTGRLARFWRDAQKEAASYSKLPMLIAKQNHLPTLVLTKIDQPLPIVDSLKQTIRVEFDDLSCEIRLFDQLVQAPYGKAAGRRRLTDRRAVYA